MAFGQLGLGTTANFGDDNGENVSGLAGIDLGTTDARTTLSVGTPVELTSGAFFQCVHFSSDLVKCWGHNGNQNGVAVRVGSWVWVCADTINVGDAPGEMGDISGPQLILSK